VESDRDSNNGKRERYRYWGSLSIHDVITPRKKITQTKENQGGGSKPKIKKAFPHNRGGCNVQRFHHADHSSFVPENRRTVFSLWGGRGIGGHRAKKRGHRVQCGHGFISSERP